MGDQERDFKNRDKRIAENEATEVVRHQARVSTWAILLLALIGLFVILYVIR